MGFYGHPMPDKRHTTWSLLKILATFEPLLWACIGDFNEILIPSEKWGGKARNRNPMKEFQQALEDCDLTDFGFYGPKYTWSNCREGVDFIKERLDRGVANQAWRDLFPEVEVHVEIVLGSDHSPIFLHLASTIRGCRNGPKFQHKASWTLVGDYLEVIKHVWDQPYLSFNIWARLGDKLKGCRSALTR